MTVLLLAAAAIGFGLVTIVAAPSWWRISRAIGVVGSLAVAGIALSMPAEESLELGGVGLVGTPLVREMAVAWSAGLAALGLLEVGVGGRPDGRGAGARRARGRRGRARDARSGELRRCSRRRRRRRDSRAGPLGLARRSGLSSRLPTTSRGSLAILGSGLLGLAVIAFGASAAGPLGAGAVAPNDPTVRTVSSLALLAMVGAVAIRCGLIPLHVWAARFMEGVSPLAIPAAFAWGSAAFVLVAIDWSQVTLGPAAAGDSEKVLIIGLSFVSLVLGGLAAMVHDDIEHVLGYSILQDAGVAVLAFASLEPEVAAAARELAHRERHDQDGARGLGDGRPIDVRRAPARRPRWLGAPLPRPGSVVRGDPGGRGRAAGHRDLGVTSEPHRVRDAGVRRGRHAARRADAGDLPRADRVGGRRADRPRRRGRPERPPPLERRTRARAGPKAGASMSSGRCRRRCAPTACRSWRWGCCSSRPWRS